MLLDLAIPALIFTNAVLLVLLFRRRPSASAAPAPRQRATVAVSSGQAPLDAPRLATTIEVSEPLAEADAEKSVDFYREVAALLTAELARDPARGDLHRKLLEVYGSAGLAQDYLKSARAYVERYTAKDPHWVEISRVGRELMPGNNVFAQIAVSGRRTFQRFYEAVDQSALTPALQAVYEGYEATRKDPTFHRELQKALSDTLLWPTPLVALQVAGGAGGKIYAKREDVRGLEYEWTVNAIGQVLLAQRLGRKQVITATHDGVHGLAAAQAAARFGMELIVFVSSLHYREHLGRMLQIRAMKGDVRVVPTVEATDSAWHAALDQWLSDTERTFLLTSLAAGPPPFPTIVRDLQTTLGHIALAQLRVSIGGAPAAVVAGIRDGYVGLGLLTAFLGALKLPLYCVEPPAVAPGQTPTRYLREHHWLRDSGRVKYVTVPDEEALEAVEAVFNAENLVIGIETGRTIAHAMRLAREMPTGSNVLTLLTRPDVAG